MSIAKGIASNDDIGSNMRVVTNPLDQTKELGTVRHTHTLELSFGYLEDLGRFFNVKFVKKALMGSKVLGLVFLTVLVM